MRSALYYPHTEVRTEGLLRSAMLTWDQLEFIAPYNGFRPRYEDRLMAEAMEIIGVARSPSDADRRKVHELLLDLLEHGVPETFHYARPGGGPPPYELWPQKLLGETWRLLSDHNVIGPLLEDADYPATEAGGLTIMAMLADVMAGETRARVTDRGFAYAAIANVANVQVIDNAKAGDVAEVTPLTFKTIALESVGLEKLIEFRKREARTGGQDYRALRHNYLKRLEAHVAEAAKYAPGSRDRLELDRAFEQDMEDDLRDLKGELGVAKRKVLLSKDAIAFVLAGVGGAGALMAGAHLGVPEAVTLAGGPAMIGGLLGLGSEFGAKRREVLRKHPMAYVYQLGP